MTRLYVLAPDAVINYITNPAMRYDTTGWNAQGATITRSLEQARFGIASLKVVTTGAALREGAFFRVSALSGISDTVTVSAYVRGTGKVRIRLDNNVVGGAEFSSQRIDLVSDRWQRISITGFSTGGNDMRLFVETDENAAISRTFYIDGAQMERKPYLTTYCDGDQPGCNWAGIEHNSLSERFDYSRQGGRWVQLAGEERVEENLYMTVAGGLGMPPVALDSREFTISPGGYVLGRKTIVRPITFTFHAKHAVNGEDEPVSLQALHGMREILIDLVNPDGKRKEELTFLYDDGLPLIFRASYDGGMEGDWDIRNQFVNSFPLRLLASDPFMVEDNQNAHVLDFQETVGADIFEEIAGRIDGEWSNMNFGFDNAVGDMELGRDGKLYASGNFKLANFHPDAIDPDLLAQYIAYWDGTQWRTLGVGAAGALINDIAIAPNGDVYITGAFTSVDGVPANRIARWNGSGWTALGTGISNDGLHVSVASDGRVYVGGSFSLAGGLITRHIAFWDGIQWHGMGQYDGLNDDVYSIAVSPDAKKVYVAGIFTDEGTFLLGRILRIAEYDVATDRFTQIGQGFDDNVNEVILGNDNTLYVCGRFVLSGTTSIRRMAKFQGGTWLPLGSGMNGEVLSFDIGTNGDIVAAGSFSQAGGVDCRNVALWNGSSWVHLDIDLNVGFTGLIALAVQYTTNGDVYIGGVGFYQNSTTHSAINYITNIGNADAAPIVYILGPGRMRWLENQTTHQRVFFDLNILNGEEVFIDFAKGEVFSTQRGNLLHSILPGSDFHAFTLAPGENKIACYMTNDVNAQMQISYVPTHWGADAVRIGLLP